MPASFPQHPFESDPINASLAEAARELATISDNVASEITQRQTWLQGLKLPLETWVTMQEAEYDFQTKMEDRDGDFLMEPRSDDLELGWTREAKEWVLATRESTFREVTNAHGNAEWKTIRHSTPTRLLEAPRDQQLLALEHFPKLVKALTATATERVKKIRATK